MDKRNASEVDYEPPLADSCTHDSPHVVPMRHPNIFHAIPVHNWNPSYLTHTPVHCAETLCSNEVRMKLLLLTHYIRCLKNTMLPITYYTPLVPYARYAIMNNTTHAMMAL